MWALWCEETLNIFKIPQCVRPVVWALYCVETLKIFKVPLCVGTVLWCVGTLKIFKLSLCVGSVLWCGDFENFQILLCVALRRRMLL